MSGLDIRAKAEALRSVSATTFTGSYQVLGTPLSNPARVIKLVNDSSVLVTVSYDGVTDQEILPIGSFVLIDFSANREVGNQFEMAANTQIWIKGVAGTGSVYLSVYYAG